MAEFCLDCWNKLTETNDPPKKYIISRELDLCEGCGQMKPVIIAVRRRYIIKEWLTEFLNDLHTIKERLP